MHILVIGASGRVGGKLVKGLLNDGHQVTGTTRQDENLFDSPYYKQIELELTAPLEEIEGTIPNNTEAIYFASGSAGKNVLQVDLHGAVKTMKAAENKGIKRYIMLSALFSLQPEKWSTLIDYYTGKYFADLWLINQTKLNYTILQPGSLTEDEGSGQIEVNVTQRGENSIENVAQTLKMVLDKSNTYKTTIPMLDGNTPIEAAVKSIS